MKSIDKVYLDNLVEKAQQGSSNAIAELTAVVYRRHYSYLLYMLQDNAAVVATLKKVYVQIFQNLVTLSDPELFMSWSNRICYRAAEGMEDRRNMRQRIKTPAGHLTLHQLSSLPMTESLVMIMRYKQKLSVPAIAYIMNFDRVSVKRCISAAVSHLKKTPGWPDARNADDNRISEEILQNEEAVTGENNIDSREKKPDLQIIQEILDEVFLKCGKAPNKVPLEELSSYAVYRKKRFSLQRFILIVILILFLLLPLLFIAPKFEVSQVPKGERGLPVVTIEVNPGIPVGKVIADVDGHSMPVYEAGAYTYNVEPTMNGTMTIEVELINKQSLQKMIEIVDVDSEGPELVSSTIDDDKIVLEVRDGGMGINYRGVYSRDAEGNIYYPVSYNEETGEIAFEYPSSKWDVYIPDHMNNRLHLSFVFE